MEPLKIISYTAGNIRLYRKFEMRFEVPTASLYPFFQYDAAPPAGVRPEIGITVEGIFTHLETGTILRHPAFYMTEAQRTLTLKGVIFIEGTKSYWGLRFAPQLEGNYSVAIYVKDKEQEHTTDILTTFQTDPPDSKGFIRVSKADPRYFEYSNGEIYWPIGPALTNRFASAGYAALADTGQTWDRPWLAGTGIYSTNWARWMSSASRAGNEGWASVLDAGVKAPDSDLSYPVRLMFPAPTYPQPYKMTLTDQDTRFAPQFKANKTYKVFARLKVAEMTGAKNDSLPYGFVVRQPGGTGWRPTESIEKFETAARSAVIALPYINQNKDWHEVHSIFKCVKNGTTLWAYLDNCKTGRVNIDTFSVREILAGGALGGEIVRNPRADEHTYTEQRPAAYLDWMVEQAEQNGIHFQFVVHDKNDWVTKRLKPDGRFGAPDDAAYYQPEDTKARWLLRNWYRYLAARWGYSTAVFAWELNNEGPPESRAHWATAEAFAKYMHEIDAHPHLASTSFWCCWEPAFWGDDETYPNIDYADLHEYTNNPFPPHESTPHDIAAWNFNAANIMGADNINKPIIRAETGITNAIDQALLRTPNPGVWYHNMLWAQLGATPLYDPGYFTTAHFIVQSGKTKGSPVIPKNQISKVFFDFVKKLEYHKGGYVSLDAVSSNPALRVLGQKNLTTNKAIAWVQNTDHTWKNVMDGIRTEMSGDVTFSMNASTPYQIEYFDACSERESISQLTVLKTEQVSSNEEGLLSIAINNLKDDVALRITSLNHGH